MSQPFNAQDSGRRAFRHDYESPDDRPVIVYLHPFWANESERLMYEDEVERNPIRDDEYRLAYLAKISETVLTKYGKNSGLPSKTEVIP